MRTFGFVWIFVLLGLSAPVLNADEGLWLFNDFPADRVRGQHGVDVTQEFLDHIRLSSTRLYPYGSGSFVSPTGLVFTNHHVASDCIQKLTTAENNYVRDGFYAPTLSDERACPDLEINVLTRIEDVTDRVKGAVTEGATPAEANRQKKTAMTGIEKACTDAGGDRCDVETMFSGGQYHLYEYKKYTDIRLVFAPEERITAFGGDPDNFTYPRYCLDFTFLRVYENGKAAKTEHFLKWSREGVQEGELTFVSGHPGTTGRLLTYSALEFARDYSYPLRLRRYQLYSQALERYSAISEDNKRIARDDVLGYQNSRKAYIGFLRGLQDEKLMARKLSEEEDLRAAVEADAKLEDQFGGLWDEVAEAYGEYEGFYKRQYLLETSGTGGSALLAKARGVLRFATETAKPNGDRLREYADSALPTREQSMFSPAPIHEDLEIVLLSAYFRLLSGELGASDPTVKLILASRTPAAAADYYVGGTKLQNVGERKRLAKDPAAVQASEDTMMRLAAIIDGPARQYRKQYADEVQAVLQSSASKVAQVRFAVSGAGDYPDATFTLRMSYGPAKGYEDSRGKWIPFTTRIGGVYERATGADPFRLPPSWLKAEKKLDTDTPFNFVTTNDTHGGNSGSPTVNAKGEGIGILFDGNIESLPNRFVFTDRTSRSVHVASQVILESLRKVYRADRILKELGVE